MQQKPLVKAEFYLENTVENISRIAKEIQEVSGQTRTFFPPQSIASPYWMTKAEGYTYETTEVLQLLIDRLSCIQNKIMHVLDLYGGVSSAVLTVVSNYENGPFISITPEQLTFLSSLHAKLIINLEGLYPE